MNLLNLIPTPYRQLVIVLVIGAVLGTVYVKGRAAGVHHSEARVTAAQQRADAAATALRAAAARLTDDAELFRRINAQVAADAKRADEQRRAAAASAARAASETARLRRTLSGLEQTLRSERATCTDGRKPICGVPLE